MSAILENVGHVENISRIGNNCCTRQIARLCQPFHVGSKCNVKLG